MKHIFTIFLFSVLIIGCKPKNLPTVSDIHKDFVEVKISHMTTKDQLIKIKTQLKEVSNIDFDYTESTFLEDGRIQFLKIAVKMPDGTIGSGFSDLMNLQYKYYGFEYNPNGSPSARIGAM